MARLGQLGRILGWVPQVAASMLLLAYTSFVPPEAQATPNPGRPRLESTVRYEPRSRSTAPRSAGVTRPPPFYFRPASPRRWLTRGALEGLFESAEHDVRRVDGVIYQDEIPVGLDVDETAIDLAVPRIRQYALTLQAVAVDGSALCSEQLLQALSTVSRKPLILQTSLRGLACLQGHEDLALELHVMSGTPAADDWDRLRRWPQPLSLDLARSRLTSFDFAQLTQIPGLRGLGLARTQLGDQELTQLCDLRELRELNLTHTNITDLGMQRIGALSQLEILNLLDNGLSDASLVHVGELDHLTELRISTLRDVNVSETIRRAHLQVRLSKHGIRSLSRLKALQVLDIQESSIRGATLNDFASLDQLREIDLVGTHLGVLDIPTRLPRLRALSLTRLELSDEDFLPLAQIRGLRQLRLVDNQGIRGRLLPALGKLPYLRVLHLGFTGLTDNLTGLQTLSGLRELRLNGTPITSRALKHIRGLEGLESLDLEETKVNAEGMFWLKELHELRFLNLNSTSVDDRGLRALQSLAKLEDLLIAGTRCTCAGVAALKKTLPTVSTDLGCDE